MTSRLGRSKDADEGGPSRRVELAFREWMLGEMRDSASGGWYRRSRSNKSPDEFVPTEDGEATSCCLLSVHDKFAEGSEAFRECCREGEIAIFDKPVGIGRFAFAFSYADAGFGT